MSLKQKAKRSFESYREKADFILGQGDRAKKYLNEALQKLIEKSPKARAFFDDMKDFIQMVTFWVEGKYQDLPYKSGVLIFGAILYFLNPFDVIPDFVPALGFTDDAAVIALVLKSVSGDLERFRDWKRELGLI